MTIQPKENYLTFALSFFICGIGIIEITPGMMAVRIKGDKRKTVSRVYST